MKLIKVNAFFLRIYYRRTEILEIRKMIFPPKKELFLRKIYRFGREIQIQLKYVNLRGFLFRENLRGKIWGKKEGVIEGKPGKYFFLFFPRRNTNLLEKSGLREQLRPTEKPKKKKMKI